jgi:LPXTG-site transpeptidase (sortase) family protein
LFLDIFNGKAKQPTRLQELATTAVVILAIVGVGWFGTELVQPKTIGSVVTVSLPAPEVSSQVVKTKEMKRSAPTNIRIPAIGVDAPIEPMGRLSDGTMQTPAIGVNLTGWYKYSPTPGEIGPAVIVGHVDDYDGPSVFWDLRNVKPGDMVSVTRADKSVAKFKVTTITQYAQADFPTEKVYSNINYAGLRLITCGGVFDYGKNRYTHNTVVYAKLIK